jgi:hypothetical protein
MEKERRYTNRIKHICSFLSKGGGTITEMLNWVNDRLANEGEKTIELRVLQECIKKLRKGDFEHSRMYEQPDPGQSMFPVVVEENKYYRWKSKSPENRPLFGILEEEERFTLPFLVGILERYGSIPSVRKVLDELPNIFNIEPEDMKSSAAIIHSGPVLYKKNNVHFQDDLINCVINILAHISRSEWIEFGYSKVNENVKEIVIHQVAPLQIRLFENYYYLIATDKEQKKVLHYRIDQIHKLLVVKASGDEEIFQLPFDRQQLEYSLELKTRFKNTLGVWLHNKADTLQEAEIEFKEWAASYMRHLKFHPSQEIVREDEAAKTIVIRFRLLMAPVSDPITELELEKRNIELAFLIARFRSYAKVLSIRPAY